MKNIVLTGFMGSGKTSVGLDLSKKLNLKFIDTDNEIEKRQGLKIKDIFDKFGEPYFRDLEKTVIKEYSLKNGFVISLGGGTFCNQENIDILKNNSFSVYLKTSIESILKRMSKEELEKRPLFKDHEYIEDLLNKREFYYIQADLTINTSDRDINRITELIISNI